MKRILLFVGVLLMLSAIPRVWAQSRVSSGYGLQTVQQTINYFSTSDPNEQMILNWTGGFVRCTWSTGSPELGYGVWVSIDLAMPPTLGNTVPSPYTASVGFLGAGSGGISFWFSLADRVDAWIGPALSLYSSETMLSRSDQPSDTWAAMGSGFSVGAAAEIDWYPFDTGWAFFDGWYCYLGVQGFFDVLNMPNFNLNGAMGIGYSL